MAGLPMRTLQRPCKVGEWTELLPINPERKFLAINCVGGATGPANVAMSFTNRDITGAFNIERFTPHIAPTNAIYVFCTSTLGDTEVTIQLIEG